MNKVYLPTSEQMDTTLENLERIAGALGEKADASSWASIERLVKSGIASRLFPVGTQFTVPHSRYGETVFDVVAHDHYKSAIDENAHTMTLMCHILTDKLQFDSAEAFYYAENELPAGTYNFTIATAYSSWGVGTYQFTLTRVLPKGGQLCINGNASVEITTMMVEAYSSRTNTVATESVAITSGGGGTNLGTFGIELNHVHRVSNGSGNYKESAIRQFLNSNASAGSVWAPQTKFDRPPSWVSSTAGFMNGLYEEFSSLVGKVIVPCAANDTYETPDSTVTKGEKYTVTDKFYLASQTEIFGTVSDVVADDSALFPYYKDVDATDRIKYRNGSALTWWTRSVPGWQTSHAKLVGTLGDLRNDSARNNYGVAAVCTIV